MKYLLDTMIWLWSLGPTEKIGEPGLQILASGEEDIFLSVASTWEIAIKAKLGKYNLPESPSPYIPKRLAQQGIRPLPVNLEHSLGTFDLPLYHADPFDRLLIAQAIAEEMVILTSDRIFQKYPVQVLWCGVR